MTILSDFAPSRDRRLLKGLMGRSFERLSGAVRDLHGTEQIGYWRGLAQVTRGTTLLSKLVGWFFHFPPAGFYPRLDQITLYAIAVERMTGKQTVLPAAPQRWPAVDRTASPDARP